MLRAKSVSCEDSCFNMPDYATIGSLVDEAIADIQNDKGKIIDVKLTSVTFYKLIKYTALILYEK